MKVYIVKYSNLKGKWAVFNEWTQKDHSYWSNQRIAVCAANDLNRHLKHLELNKKLQKLSTQEIHNGGRNRHIRTTA